MTLGGAVRLLLGLGAPAGHPTVPTISLPDLAADPMGAVRGYWRTLLTAHPEAITELLGVLRDVLGSASAVGAAITGTGTAADAWRVPLADGLELQVHVVATTEVHVALAGTTRVETLGQGCTSVEGTLAVELATLDLGAGHASLLTGLVGALALRGTTVDPERAVLDLGAARLEADRVGIAMRWAPVGGLRFTLDAPNLGLVADGTTVPLPLPALGEPLDDLAWDALQTLLGLLAPHGPSWLADVVRLLGWSGGTAARNPAARLRLADVVGPGADPAAALRTWLGAVAVELGPDVVAFLSQLLTGTAGTHGLIDGLGTPDQPFALPLAAGADAPELVVWFPPHGPEVRDDAGPDQALVRAGDELVTWRPGNSGLDSDLLARALADEALVARDVADLVWNRDLAGGLEGLVARWAGGDGRVVPPATAPTGVDVVTVPEAAAGQLADVVDLDQLLDHEPPAVIRVRIASNATAAFPDVPADRLVDLTLANRAPETFDPPAAAAGEWYVALAPRAVAALPTGDPDGTLGQAARLARVFTAFAGLGAGQVVVGEGGAGHAARLAAATCPEVSDVVTLGTPLGPVSLTVLDDAGAGDVWRLLADLLPPEQDADDDDLALGRALVRALAEVDPAGDPGAELRPPTAFPDRAGLTVHAVFGVVSDPAVRRGVTAAVAAGLAARARSRAALGDVTGAVGVRAGLRTHLTSGPTDALVVEGHVTIDLGGVDLGTGGPQHRHRPGGAGVGPHRRPRRLAGRRTRSAAGAGPVPGARAARAGRRRHRAARRRLDGSAAARVVAQGAQVFGVAHERLEATPTGEPVGAEVRLLLSLAVGRIVAEATAATASPAAVALRSVLEGLQLVAGDGGIADAVESLVHDPAALASATLADATRRTAVAAGARTLLGAAAPLTGDDPAAVRIGTDTVTVVADLTTRSLTLDAPAAGGPFGCVGARVAHQ